MTSTITAHIGPALLCLCQRGCSSTPQKSVKIVNGFFLYFAILMDVIAHSSCIAYSEAPDCSLPGALELLSCKKCP